MAVVRESVRVPIAAAAAQQLWTDTSRWPTFVDGFARVLQKADDWPAPGSKVVWESGPAGRGRVTERIRESTATSITSEVFEDQLTGVQTITFEPEGEGAFVEIALDYDLQKGGPLRKLTDVLFIRRAVADSLARTLRRFSTEAAEQATL
jgi:hypothetical protein